jgi:hypothetical protein
VLCCDEVEVCLPAGIARLGFELAISVPVHDINMAEIANSIVIAD